MTALIRELTDTEIDAVWQSMPGGASGFNRQWGYLQFARAVLNAASLPPAQGVLDLNHATKV